MASLLFSIFRDLYLVLLVILVLEQIPGSDLLHDLTRKGVITATVCFVIAKLIQPLVEGPSGGPVRAPRRQKKTEGGRAAEMEWASSEMQGWRPAMEDSTCIVASLPTPLTNQALFAVFDGHGGSQVALIASKEFPKVLGACATNLSKAEDGVDEEDSPAEEEASEKSAKSSEQTPDAGSASEVPSQQQLPGKALHLAMLTMDSFLRKGGSSMSARSAVSGPLSVMANQLESAEKNNAFSLVGSTACVVLVDCDADSTEPGSRVRPRRLTVANCGDSRAVLCRNGKAIELSEDHKPELPGEEERIKKAGGHVAMIGPCHRVDGWGLNLSRALGDFHYKARADLPPEQQKVIAVPEIRTLDLEEEDEFLVLGCDGIFELNTSQKAVDIVREALELGLSTEQAVEELVDRSCSPNLMQTRGKGGDNCSAIVVRLP